MFVDASLGSSKRGKIQVHQGCSEHGGEFSNSFLVPVGQEAGRSYRGIQGKLKIWERLVQSMRIEEEAEGRSAGVGDSGRGDQPRSVVLQE